MSDKLRPLDVIFMSILIVLCISLIIGVDKGYIGLQKTEQNYINTNEWTEKCSQYEYYKEHEIGHMIKLTDELTCNVGYRACLIKDNINITCKQQKTECIEQYSTPHIITINNSRCVETILVKVS